MNEGFAEEMLSRTFP